MKKNLLALMLAGGLAVSAMAEDVTFSYAYETDENYGTLKKETYDVAIFLPGSSFAGFKIKTINGPLNESQGYKDGSVWLTSELTLESKVNVPDMGSWNAEVTPTGISFTLPEAVTIPAEGIYVGYSFAIDKLDNGSKYPIPVSKTGGNADSFFLHASKSIPSKFSNLGLNGYASGLSVVLEVESLASRNVVISSMPENIYMSIGETKTIDVTLSSSSEDPVDSVGFEFEINGTEYTYDYVLPEAVPAGIGRQFNAQIEIPAQSKRFNGDVAFNVVKVNGLDNEAKNPSVLGKLTVMTKVPVHQALFEEYTGTWCGWCTRGYAALEYIKKNHPDFVVAAYHNDDPMQVTTSYPVTVGGFPFSSLDRAATGDPYSWSKTSGFNIVSAIEDINSKFVEWGVEAKATIAENGIITVNSEVFCVGDVDNNTNKLAYILVADGITGTDPEDLPSNAIHWYQSNYYSGYAQSSANIPELNKFCSGGVYGTGQVTGLVFDDVVISNQGYKGVAGSLPQTMESEVPVTHEYTFNISNNTLAQNKDRLYVIVAVLDSTGKSINCCKVHVEIANGVEDVLDNNANAPVEYYNLNGVRIANPENGIFIRKQGSKTSKVAL